MGLSFEHPVETLESIATVTLTLLELVRFQSRPIRIYSALAVQWDWAGAPEYVEAMWLMLQRREPDDFVIATGEANRLEDFCAAAFAEKGLNWRDHVEIDQQLFRPTEIMYGCGNPAKAKKDFGWEARAKMRDVVRKMLAAEP